MKFGMLLSRKEMNVCLGDRDIDLLVCPFDVILAKKEKVEYFSNTLLRKIVIRL